MHAPVFISHATTDHPAAHAIRDALEAAGIACWIAPRDIPPGHEWASAIAAAIAQAPLLILIHSAASAASDMVRREINLAAADRTPIMPIRIDETLPADAMLFYLGATHWLDAPAPLPPHLPRITAAAHALLARPTGLAEHPTPLAATPFEERPAIAVLPFRAPPEHQQRAEDLTDALITIRTYSPGQAFLRDLRKKPA